MTDRDGFRQGEISWADLQSSGREAAVAFYRSLFGWEFETTALSDGYSYSAATLNGRVVAGVGDLPPGSPAETSSAWLVYFHADDVDAVADDVPGAGGTIVYGPGDVLEQGRMLVATDPAGAIVQFWQPITHKGFGVINENGAYTWAELLAPEAEKAVPFYSDTLGVGSTREVYAEGAQPYTMLTLDDVPVAGAWAAPPETPPHWQLYFYVDDIAAAVSRIGELGGTVIGAVDSAEGVGQFVAAQDPTGAGFSLLQPDEQ